jgi:hypothetical protein
LHDSFWDVRTCGLIYNFSEDISFPFLESPVLQMKVVNSLEEFMHIYQTTRCRNPLYSQFRDSYGLLQITSFEFDTH